MGKRRLRRDDYLKAAGVLTRVAYRHAKAAGIAVDRLLKKARLTREQIINPKIRIDVRDQIRLVNAVADALHDDCLGFHLAENLDVREIGLLYYVMASSDRLVDALKAGARYNSLVNEAVLVSYRHDKRLVVSLRYRGVSRHTDRHQIEFWVTAIVSTCRRLTGRRMVPVRVRFSHWRGHIPPEFVPMLGSNVEFGAPIDEIVFDRKAGDYALPGADPHLHRLLVGYCEDEIARRRSQPSFRSEVENAIIPGLRRGQARADIVARELGVSQRTLARRLGEEGVTFSAVVKNLRADLAQDYLTDSTLPISEIAFRLGYREIGAFSHAFKRMTGKTPREVRVDKRTRRSAPSLRL